MGATVFELHFFFGFLFFQFVVALSLYGGCRSGWMGAAEHGGGESLVLCTPPSGGGATLRTAHAVVVCRATMHLLFAFLSNIN